MHPNRKKETEAGRGRPVVRLRHVAGVVAVLALLVSVPLLFVWKQVYIRQLSLRREAVSDSLSAVNRQLMKGQMTVETYSTGSRIEKLATQKMGLSYSSDRIIVIHEKPRPVPASIISRSRFLTILRRSADRG